MARLEDTYCRWSKR